MGNNTVITAEGDSGGGGHLSSSSAPGRRSSSLGLLESLGLDSEGPSLPGWFRSPHS